VDVDTNVWTCLVADQHERAASGTAVSQLAKVSIDLQNPSRQKCPHGTAIDIPANAFYAGLVQRQRGLGARYREGPVAESLGADGACVGNAFGRLELAAGLREAHLGRLDVSQRYGKLGLQVATVECE